MTFVAYFTTVVARTGSSWRARDVEVDEHDELEDLADSLRAAGSGDGPVLAVIEHEDEWFALVRVDGEDDEPTVFVSDLAAVSKSRYGALLAAAEPPGEAEEPPATEEDDAPAPAPRSDSTWAGEADLLDDLGVSGPHLRKLVADLGDDPAAVLAEIGEQAGFAELLENLR
jgi:putative tRNA adenosine deaminase-associated protein